ncbi:putative FMN/FAD exporter YeeO [subsurface metagenome]
MKQLFRDIWDAIRGYEYDLTKIKLGKAILLLSIPMVVEMLMESFFAILDIYFVSRLGDEAISVVGLTESLMTIVYAIGIGLAMATTGIVARRIGEKRDRDASIAASQAILLGILISAFIAIPGIIFAKKILGMMNAEQKVIDIGFSFTQIMLGGNFVIMLLFINNAIFRSAGAPALSMRVLLVANAINIVLDPCLIFGIGPFPQLGVTGAAVATSIGRGIGVLYQFYLLFKHKSRIDLRLSDFILHLKVMWKVLYLSGGGILQYLIATSSWVILYRILADYKSEVIAGYTIAIRVFVFFLLPAWGFSNAASTLVGQNLGAKDPGRAERAVWYTSIVNSAYMLIAMLGFVIFPQYFIKLFSDGGKSYEVGVACLQIMGYGMVFYGFGMIIAQAFNGAGDTYTPTVLNFICFWLIEIPLAYYLAKNSGMKENGVFYSILISETILAILGILVFLRGKWKLRTV